MKQAPRLGTLFALAACLIIAYPSSASAIPIHRHVVVKPTGLIPALKGTYVVHVAPKDGDDDGFANAKDDCPSTAGPDNGCPPPKPEPTVASSTYSSGVAPSTPVITSYGSGGTCPASLAGEASSPTAVNASSGAAGCIQAIPSTWAAYGDPAYASAAEAPIDVQMAAMARICAAQGNDAWTAADPC